MFSSQEILQITAKGNKMSMNLSPIVVSLPADGESSQKKRGKKPSYNERVVITSRKILKES